MTAPALTHLAFNSPNLDRMVAFYQTYAGMRLIHEREDDGVRVAWIVPGVENPPLMFVLIAGEGNQPAAPSAMEHLGFECATRAEVDEVARRAKADGLEILMGPVDWPPPVGYFVIIADPDGNRVEFSHGQGLAPVQS